MQEERNHTDNINTHYNINNPINTYTIISAATMTEVNKLSGTMT